MLKLSSPITDVPRVGPVKGKYFEKLGVSYVRDLLYSFPRKYEDFSQIAPIASLQEGKTMAVRAHVKNVNAKWGFQGRRRLLRIFVTLEDDTGELEVMWFNLRFLAQQLRKGREMYIAGKVEIIPSSSKYRMRSPSFEFADADASQTHTAAITPVYSETYGVTSRFIRYQVRRLLPLVQSIPEYLPRDIVKRHQLMSIHDAVAAAHFPKNSKELEAAQRRLRFDELFFLQLAALVRRKMMQQQHAPAISAEGGPASGGQQYINSLPFSLTSAQKIAVDEILRDMQQTRPMNRLLQGDVGSGKSAVALIATQVALAAGYKVLYLAPTEILARQQAESFGGDLPAGRQAELLIGATSQREKKRIKNLLQQDGPVLVVGTHALLQEDVKAKRVGLVIIDEQHRFGVEQRAALLNVGRLQPTTYNLQPHLLSMTATPIPRTLNLTVYGDLDVSVLNELPPGRKPVQTSIVLPGKRDDAIIHTLKELHAGRQAFVIAPLIEESASSELKSAKETYEEMRKLFPGVAVGLVHGKMKSEEKEAVMRNMAAGAIQLLVSTAVVEVGVNIPNATVMIIEGAERFGLSQLHQFRGRVGRGEHKSYCYLFPTTEEAARAERLQVLCRTNDGFVIAEEDLRLRGPGEVYGVAQSGFSDLKVASLLDYEMIKLTRSEAQKLLEKDPDITHHSILRRKVEQKNAITHFE